MRFFSILLLACFLVALAGCGESGDQGFQIVGKWAKVIQNPDNNAERLDNDAYLLITKDTFYNSDWDDEGRTLPYTLLEPEHEGQLILGAESGTERTRWVITTEGSHVIYLDGVKMKRVIE